MVCKIYYTGRVICYEKEMSQQADHPRFILPMATIFQIQAMTYTEEVEIS